MSTRNSVQREWIYDYIQRQDAHLSADEIYEGLLKEGKNISLATVYRNLSILVDEYKIASVMTDSKKQVYDKTCKPHDHFVCTKCHKMYDIDLPYDRSIEAKFTKQLDISIESHALTLYGICHDCHQERRGK